MPVERMKTGCVNFRQHAQQIGYHSNILWLIRYQMNMLLWSRLIAVRLLKVWWRSIYRLWCKQRKRAYFCMCASTHLLQTGHNTSMIYYTKVHEIFTRCIPSLGLGLGYSCDIFPTVVKCQHKQWSSFMPTSRRFAQQNWLLWKHPLTEVHLIFSCRNFFMDGANAAIRYWICAPSCMDGRTDGRTDGWISHEFLLGVA